MGHSFDIVVDEGVACPLSEERLGELVSFVLREEGVERPCMVSLSVVSDERMAELNAQWRGQARPTDVLSLECERPDDPDLAPGEPCELGDLVLAPAYIARQAADFGTTAEAECTLLLIHGTLHLLGYDHLEDDEAAVMEAREDELFARALGTRLAHVELTRHRGDDEA